MNTKLLQIMTLAVCASLYSVNVIAQPTPDAGPDFSNVPKGTLEDAAKASGISVDALTCKQKSDAIMVKCMDEGMKNNLEGYVKKCGAEANTREEACIKEHGVTASPQDGMNVEPF